MIKADKSRAVSSFIKSVFPSELFANRMWIWPLAMLLSFLWFDVVWCMATTFTSFSMAETYINSVLISLILALPAMVWHKRRLQWVILVVICIWLECNLLYSRTYFSTIPLESYLLASNLSDFTSSVTDSLRWSDLGFVVIISAALVWGFPRRRDVVLSGRNKLIYCGYILFLGLVSSCMLVCRGGFKQAWERLENGNYHSCRIPMFTVAGSMIHDYMASGNQMSESDKVIVDDWLNLHTELVEPADSTMLGGEYDSMVLILCESLESWPIGLTLEGKEITPNLNHLVSDSSTLYSPNVLSQVGPGRSIDAQLIINVGMLPMERGVYSMQVPFNTYLHVEKFVAKRGDGIMHRGHFCRIYSVFFNNGLAGQIADGDDVVGLIHAIFFNSEHRWVDITAGAVEVGGMYMDHERLSGHLLCVDSGGICEPVVGVDHIEVKGASDHAGANRIVVDLFEKIVGVAAGEFETSEIVGAHVVEVGINMVSEPEVEVGIHIFAYAVFDVFAVYISPGDRYL